MNFIKSMCVMPEILAERFTPLDNLIFESSKPRFNFIFKRQRRQDNEKNKYRDEQIILARYPPQKPPSLLDKRSRDNYI